MLLFLSDLCLMKSECPCLSDARANNLYDNIRYEALDRSNQSKLQVNSSVFVCAKP